MAYLLPLLLLAALGCSDDKDPVVEPTGPQSAPQATTAEIAMDNLVRAFDDRDTELYETLLDERFWFTETDCEGNIVFFNGREEELAIMGGRDNSEGLLDRFRTVEYEFRLIERSRELGIEFPLAFEGDPDGHPDEDWEVFRGRVEILLLVNPTDGFRVDQIMTFKMRQGTDGLWRIVRWIDDPLSGDGDCILGKATAQGQSWGSIKASLSR